MVFEESSEFLARPGQSLEKHLNEVSDLAAQFAVGFNAEKISRFAAFLHDYGKATKGFQEHGNKF